MNKLLKNRISVKEELVFVVLAFGITWLIWIPFLLSGAEGISPLITLGAWGPSLAAFIILYQRNGKPGVRQLVKKVTRWRVSPRWYTVAIVLPAAIATGTTAAMSLLQPGFSPGMVASALPGGSFLSLPVIFLVNVFFGGPLAEEFGWRGYLVPRAQDTLAPFTTGMLVGIIWVVWHTPLFILGSQSSVVGGIPFVWYLPLITGFSVIFVYLFNGTGGSVLLCVLFHASINTFIGMISLADVEQFSFAFAVMFTWISVVIIVFSTKAFSGKVEQNIYAQEGLYAESS